MFFGWSDLSELVNEFMVSEFQANASVLDLFLADECKQQVTNRAVVRSVFVCSSAPAVPAARARTLHKWPAYPMRRPLGNTQII